MLVVNMVRSRTGVSNITRWGLLASLSIKKMLVASLLSVSVICKYYLWVKSAEISYLIHTESIKILSHYFPYPIIINVFCLLKIITISVRAHKHQVRHVP